MFTRHWHRIGGLSGGQPVHRVQVGLHLAVLVAQVRLLEVRDQLMELAATHKRRKAWVRVANMWGSSGAMVKDGDEVADCPRMLLIQARGVASKTIYNPPKLAVHRMVGGFHRLGPALLLPLIAVVALVAICMHGTLYCNSELQSFGRRGEGDLRDSSRIHIGSMKHEAMNIIK